MTIGIGAIPRPNISESSNLGFCIFEILVCMGELKPPEMLVKHHWFIFRRWKASLRQKRKTESDTPKIL
jgi:hypothetical protein